MKKLLLSLVILICANAFANAQTYLNTPWTLDNMTSIKQAIGGMLGDQFLDGKINFNPDISQADILFKKKDNDDVKIRFEQYYINADPDERIKGQKVIGGIYTMDGAFRDLFNIYVRLFDANADADLFKKNGHADVISKTEGKIKYKVAFVRNGEYWRLLIRDFSR